MTLLPAICYFDARQRALQGQKQGKKGVVVASSRGLHVKNTTYMVKTLDGATLPVGVYQVATDAPDVRRLVALAIDADTAQRIAGMLSGDDLVEDDDGEVEAAQADLWAWRTGAA